MTYYVYENWTSEGRKAKIHLSNCSFCIMGKVFTQGQATGTENGTVRSMIFHLHFKLQRIRVVTLIDVNIVIPDSL